MPEQVHCAACKRAIDVPYEVRLGPGGQTWVPRLEPFGRECARKAATAARAYGFDAQVVKRA